MIILCRVPALFLALQLCHIPLLSILSFFYDTCKLFPLMLLSCTVRLTPPYISPGPLGGQVMMLFPLSICSIPFFLLWSWLLSHISPCVTHHLLPLTCLLLLTLLDSYLPMLLWYLLLPTPNIFCLWGIIGSILSLPLLLMLLPVYLPILMI